jgi:hypothetical protein
MLGTTEYLAIVGGGKQPIFPQNKVCPELVDWPVLHADRYEIHIWNDRTQKVVTTLEFNSPVQRVRINRHYVVVVLLNSVKIYKMKVPPEKLAEYETVNMSCRRRACRLPWNRPWPSQTLQPAEWKCQHHSCPRVAAPNTCSKWSGHHGRNRQRARYPNSALGIS